MVARPTSLHWPEYLIEAGALGTFMALAATFAAALYYPASPAAALVSNELMRRGFMGLAMGATAVLIIYSPWGQRSGAHMNPAVTLTFFRLGKVARPDLVGYMLAQFAGAIVGLSVAAAALRGIISDPSVNYITTTPGTSGNAVAFLAEVAISFALMLTVLTVSNHPRWAPFTGLSAGLLVWAYITVEAPLSGMSMNPARTFGSAVLSGDYLGLWIYFTAPVLGMLLAAELFTRRYGVQRVLCAKLHHPHGAPCIFGCGDSAAPVAPSA